MRRTPQPQRGAALLVAMLILTLVSTLAAGMVWQQWRATEVESAERARVQAGWILTGALDWGRLVLREDGRSGGPDHLGEVWATPLAETRLSTFLSNDRDHGDGDGGPEAFLSGGIRDVQSRYNLRNLVAEDKIVEKELQVLKRLCETAEVSQATADLIATGLLAAWRQSDPGSTADGAAALAPHSMAQLQWLGVDAQSIQRLVPFVDLLPSPTPVNANTASREVLAGVIDGLDPGSAERLVQVRQRTPFKSLAEIEKQIDGGKTKLDAQRVGISSNFFEISGRLRLDGRVLEEHSIVLRSRMEVQPVARERYSVLPSTR